MPGDWDNSVHPDLIDEDEGGSASPPEPAPTPSARGRTTRSRAGGSDGAHTPPADSAAPSEGPEPGPDGAAESDQSDLSWFEQVREAKDPTEALRLLAKNLPRDQFEKDDVVSGLIGQIGDRRARDLLARQERDAQDRAKLEAAANNDLYTLGEMTQRGLQQQLASQQAAQAAGPFMDGVVLFQKQLPETIQKEVAGQTFGAGKGYAEGVAEYMAFVVDRAVKLEQQKRESALRKSVMSELNGDEPVPERDSGTPGRVREVTDETIAAMSLAEYEALFDENGRPKPGVRHRSTRGIPVRQH
jgi:hypothetical protein